MKVREYVGHDATSLAALIRSGQVTAGEVREVAREAIEAVNPELIGVVGDLFDGPLAYSQDGPLAGAPFAIKDLVLHAQGVPSRSGTRMTGDGILFPYDTDLMSRFRRAGLVTLGRTTTPEFGFNASTESVATGPTRNPWDTSRSPGGVTRVLEPGSGVQHFY